MPPKRSFSDHEKVIEEKEFLLQSLEDLDVEHAVGDLTDIEFETLKKDYSRRLAAVVRKMEGVEQVSPPVRRQSVWWVAIILAVGSTLGIAVAQFSGLRAPGEPISGEIDVSPRTRLADARESFLLGDLDSARSIVEEVLRDAPDLAGALILSAQIHERAGDPLPAVRQLDQVLKDEPNNVDALTLRGWILVRIDDVEVQAEGVAALDKALSLEPDTFDPYVFRGFVARVLEADFPLAIRMYTLALDRNPPQAMQVQLERFIEEMTGD